MSNKVRTFSDIPKYELSLSLPDGISRCVLTKEEIEHLLNALSNALRCMKCNHLEMFHNKEEIPNPYGGTFYTCEIGGCSCKYDLWNREVEQEPFCGAV